ncbi:hypothetical protein [endosymbiont of unidentified scaly snail isolate Monju]|uniref:hypothetical protein n=1 Tax=endosymbiont of unidentified scaly snail isolate Monju TaxID=1248727 RepID=UPI001E29595F|nr:hypothetical protein [endosymbiont of unidentified scaly snail isolate Monju]
MADGLVRNVRRIATGWEAELRIAVEDLVPVDKVLTLCETFYAATRARHWIGSGNGSVKVPLPTGFLSEGECIWPSLQGRLPVSWTASRWSDERRASKPGASCPRPNQTMHAQETST